MRKRATSRLSLSLSLLLPVLSLAGEGLETLTFDAGSMNVITRETAMPEMGEGRLDKILTRYYTEGLGGPGKWLEIESIELTGLLKTASGNYRLTAYQKKPNLLKLSLTYQRGDLVLGYNGEEAWKQLPGSGREAEPMDEKDARRFIHSSQFGSHLLYPYAEGKTISYVDTVPLDGSICHLIRVDLETHHRVDYYIDIRSYMEVRVESLDLRDQSLVAVELSEYNRDNLLPIAEKVVNYTNGEWTSELTVETIKVNCGVMPWMFDVPK